MFRLDDRTALVTGASRGIGRAIASLFASRGARVVVAARSVDDLETLAEEIRSEGGEAHPLALDLADPGSIDERLAAVPEDWLPVEILVNNAGITDDTLIARMKLDQWERVVGINLTGTFAVTKAVIKGMMKNRWGRIVTVSSVVGLMGNAGQANYAASKAGLVGFTKSLARELGSRSITANAIAPGYVETAMTDELAESSRDQLTRSIAVGRLGTVDDVAHAALFLASEEAGYVTGHVLNVSGGLYI